MKDVDWSVYIITDRRAAGGRSLVELVGAAIAGGATAVQLREKGTVTREIIRLGHALHEVTRAAGIPLIINDRVDVALALDAEGVHVGQDDIPAPVARRLIGPDRILGVSVSTADEARRAELQGADYLGVGDIFGTPSKPDAGSPIGVGSLVRIVRAVSIPVVAIGGITPENAAAVIQAGAVGVAVISAVFGAEDVAQATRDLRARVRPAAWYILPVACHFRTGAPKGVANDRVE
ncbi:MAG: thiamine phosphate synthase [Ardenticatenaceae bacterium]|nr:thiamine phosphate synthase [Ardenticatenaceae bacterium]